MLVVRVRCATLGVENPFTFVFAEPTFPMGIPFLDVFGHVRQQHVHGSCAFCQERATIVPNPHWVDDIRRRQPLARVPIRLRSDPPRSEASPSGRVLPRIGRKRFRICGGEEMKDIAA